MSSLRLPMSQDDADRRTSGKSGYRGDRRRDDARGDRGKGPKKDYRGAPRDGRRDDRRSGRREGQGHGQDRRDGQRRDARPRNYDNKSKGDRPKGDRSHDKPRDRSHGDRSQGERRDRRYDGKRDYQHGERREYRRDDRAPRGKEEQRPREQAEVRLTIPSTPEKILFKGIDCEVNGRKDLALRLYLHGAAKLSGGCESNAARMLREMGREEFATARGRAAKDSPEEVLVAFDYICSTIDPDYDVTFLESRSSEGDPLAVYSLIRLGRIGGDDPRIDALASHADEDEAMVRDGLKLLVRKKDSKKAEDHLKAMDRRAKERQSIGPAFIKAMRGDASARRRLADLSSTFPDAGFLLGYLDSTDREAYLREGMQDHSRIIVSMSAELGISDTPFGRFLSAKKVQSQGGDWIQPMINAVVAGSDDAVAELMPVKNRKDVRKGLASMYLARGDAAGLVGCYDGEDADHLDRYCGLDGDRTVEVARLMGGSRGLDWLKRGCLKGMDECRRELVSMARSGEHNSKQLVYILHDIGEELESAKLYMAMYGDRSLPSVKWLSKVCEDAAAKEFLRSRFEQLGETAVFESIFVDDGYEKRSKPKGNGRGGKGRRR